MGPSRPIFANMNTPPTATMAPAKMPPRRPIRAQQPLLAKHTTSKALEQTCGGVGADGRGAGQAGVPVGSVVVGVSVLMLKVAG